MATTKQRHLIHAKSNVTSGKTITIGDSILNINEPKKPALDRIEYGELAINYAVGSEAIFLKNSNNNFIQINNLKNIRYDGEVDNSLNVYLDEKYVNSSGDTIDGNLIVHGNEFNFEGRNFKNISDNVDVTFRNELFIKSNEDCSPNHGVLNIKTCNINVETTDKLTVSAESVFTEDVTLNGSTIIKELNVSNNINVSGNTILNNADITGLTNINNLTVNEITLPDNSILYRHIAPGEIKTENIDNLSITNEKLSNNSVNSSKIADESITTEKIADNSIIADKLVDGSITNNKLAANAIGSNNIKNNAISSDKILDGSITHNKLSDNSVETTNIVNLNVTTSKIADNAVTENKLADNSVSTRAILDNSIINSKISVNAIGTDNVQNGSITQDKLAEELLNLIENIEGIYWFEVID